MTYAGATNDERTTAGTIDYQNGSLGVQTQGTTTCTLLLVCTTATTSFVRDPQGTLIAERIGSDEYYYVFDGLGSIIALIDAAGIQRAAYTYDPYGGHATATALNGALPPNPWRYAGGQLDTTGLYKYGARYYDPNIGRWTQQDSIVALGDPANANRYAYAGDNPVNYTDPAGRCPKELEKYAADLGYGDFARFAHYYVYNFEEPGGTKAEDNLRSAVYGYTGEKAGISLFKKVGGKAGKLAGKLALPVGVGATAVDAGCALHDL